MGILEPGRNCWRVARASRAAVLVDAAAYFEALAAAVERAERSVVLLGWDFHSRVRLRRGAADEDERSRLVTLLERAVRRKRRLRVYLLPWDYSMIYAREREWLPRVRFGLATHRRIRVELDAQHPLGASQHEKLAVIDGRLAFCGGLDLTVCRWDTREHRPDDPRREDPGNPGYAPFHDVQMAVDGEAAQALAELAAARWRRATGRSLRIGRMRSDPWPPGLEPQLRDVWVGIARTRPPHQGREAVREVEQLYLDSIEAARDTIYLENQYFSSHRVVEALATRLEEPDGPEVVVLLPGTLGGWLEESTIGVMMARVGRRLRESDRHGRLRLLTPKLADGGALKVHSKVAIVDERFLRVGSANLSNRSMGLDSECDLALESTPERDLGDDIARIRADLLAEHLDVAPEAVLEAHRREGSLRGAIEALAGRERTLVKRNLETGEWLDAVVPDGLLFDPERPIGFEALGEFFAGTAGSVDAERPGRSRARLAAGAAALLALFGLWQWTPLAEHVTPEGLASLAAGLGDDPLRWPLAVLFIAVASSLLVPITALIAAGGALFGFVPGFLVGLGGALLATGLGVGAGRLLWRDTVQRLAGERLSRLSRRLARRGVLAVAAVRLVPVAPFGVVNLVIGSLHVRARDALLGTALGMAPGTLALAFFGERALDALREPGWRTVSAALAVLALIALGSLLARRELAAEDAAPDA